MITAPMVALTMSRTALPPRLTPSCGNSQLATSAPMMPITMLPISPKPAPRTISPASQPAIWTHPHVDIPTPAVTAAIAKGTWRARAAATISRSSSEASSSALTALFVSS